VDPAPVIVPLGNVSSGPAIVSIAGPGDVSTLVETFGVKSKRPYQRRAPKEQSDG